MQMSRLLRNRAWVSGLSLLTLGELAFADDFSQALDFFRAGQYEASATLLRGLVKSDSSKALYWFNLANADYQLGRFREAIGSYKKVIELKSPLSDAAYFYLAQAYVKLGQDLEAKEALRALQVKSLPPHLAEAVLITLAEPSKSERAMKAYTAQDYPNALVALDEMIRSKPSADAYFLKGLTLLRLHDPQNAKLAFENTIASSTDPRQQADSRLFIRQIQEGSWEPEKRFRAALDFWSTYNSNIFANGESESALAKPELHIAGVLHYVLSPEWLLEYRPRWDEIFTLPDNRLVSHLVRLRISKDRGAWFLSAAPSLEYVTLGQDSYVFRSALQLRTEVGFSTQTLGASLNLEHDFAVDTAYSYLSGNIIEGRLYWSLITAAGEVSVFIAGGKEAIGTLTLPTGTLPLGNDSLGGGMGLQRLITPRVKVDLSASYFRKNYSQVSSPGLIERVDNLWNFAVIAHDQKSQRFMPFATVARTFNQSTLGAGSVADLLGVYLECSPLKRN